jgi:hypothetical protein
MGKLLGLKGCSNESGWHGDGTPNDPYRLALDGSHDAVDVAGIEASTGADYTVQVWFRVRTNEKGLVIIMANAPMITRQDIEGVELSGVASATAPPSAASAPKIAF